jgi:hypothetical protein
MPSYQLNLDRAYAIRAEMIALINDKLDAREIVPEGEVIDSVLARHTDVPRDCVEHLAARVFKHWGMPGLDYHEAPIASGFTDMRAWYPVERNGRLERVAPDELFEAEFAFILRALREQAECAAGQVKLLERRRG